MSDPDWNGVNTHSARAVPGDCRAVLKAVIGQVRRDLQYTGQMQALTLIGKAGDPMGIVIFHPQDGENPAANPATTAAIAEDQHATYIVNVTACSLKLLDAEQDEWEIGPSEPGAAIEGVSFILETHDGMWLGAAAATPVAGNPASCKLAEVNFQYQPDQTRYAALLPRPPGASTQ